MAKMKEVISQKDTVIEQQRQEIDGIKSHMFDNISSNQRISVVKQEDHLSPKTLPYNNTEEDLPLREKEMYEI